MRFRSRHVNADWFHITWDEGREEPPAHWRTITDIPGVIYRPEALEIPRTVWHLDAVADFCDAVGVNHPQHNTARYSGIPLWEPAQPQLPHQPVVTRMLLDACRVLLADTMGTGKTRSAIQAAETVRRNVFHKTRPVVIVGPLRTRATWFRELLAMGATTADKLCACESRDMDGGTWRPDADYYFVHFDVVDCWWSRIYAAHPCVAIGDEVHHCKNGKSVRAKNAALVFKTTQFRLLLTGTPIANKPRDLFTILDMLNGTKQWGTPGQFRERYCGAYSTSFGLKDGEPDNVEELQERLEPFYLRRTIEDAGITLPPFTREIVTVTPNVAKTRVMRDFTNALRPDQLANLVKLFMGGGTNLFGPTIKLLGRLRKMTSDLKRESTVELAADVLAATGAIVIFTWQRDTAHAIAKALDDTHTHAAYVITGDMPQAERDGCIELFQRDGGAIVATYGALADSVTLTRSRATIHHDLDWVPSTMLQAEKRTHRISQEHGCKAYWMVAPGSLDAVLLAALRKKCADTELMFALEAAIPEIAEAAEVNSFESRMTQSIQEWREW